MQKLVLLIHRGISNGKCRQLFTFPHVLGAGSPKNICVPVCVSLRYAAGKSGEETVSTSLQASLAPMFNMAVQEDRIRGLFTVSVLISQRKNGDEF